MLSSLSASSFSAQAARKAFITNMNKLSSSVPAMFTRVGDMCTNISKNQHAQSNGTKKTQVECMRLKSPFLRSNGSNLNNSCLLTSSLQLLAKTEHVISEKNSYSNLLNSIAEKTYQNIILFSTSEQMIVKERDCLGLGVIGFEEDENGIASESIWMSSTLKKRKAKMNKHKLRKRRKKLRLKSK